MLRPGRFSRRHLLTKLPSALLGLFSFVAAAKTSSVGERQPQDAGPQPTGAPWSEPPVTTYTFHREAFAMEPGSSLHTTCYYDYGPDQREDPSAAGALRITTYRLDSHGTAAPDVGDSGALAGPARE